MNQRSALLVTLFGLLAGAATFGVVGAAEPVGSAGQLSANARAMINQYCLDCHSRDDSMDGLDLETISAQPIPDNRVRWEKVVKKLRTRQMPPRDSDQPIESTLVEALHWIEHTLDEFAALHPHPGRTDSFRRLTRFEYRNAIRDLLAIDVDVTALLPPDEISHGFDSVSVGELSPTLVSRYVTAAQKISRLAVGRSSPSPDGKTFRIPPDVTQEEHVEGLPIGTRGGGLFSYHFPQDGEYEIQVRLTRDRNEHVEGLSEPHDLELLLDQELVDSWTVAPPRSRASSTDSFRQPNHEHVDRHLKSRISVTGGPHQLGIAFVKNPTSLLETRRQPLNVHFNMYRHPRLGPAVYQVSVTGPFNATGAGNTPSRRQIFICQPTSVQQEDECAERILSRLLRRACRQPIDSADLAGPMQRYREARQQGDFQEGIELALGSILVHPKFLFRIERDPQDVPPQTVYEINDLELASRLSFFLWSSLPDEELLLLAEQGQLSDAVVLEQQVRRLLADQRADALTNNFSGQWLYLRNLDSITPDARLFPDFDDNLRQSLRRETELLFASIVRQDRNVLDLLRSDDTYLNERLAKHYGIPHVHGSRFRRVILTENSHRGGLLRHGSILTVTSYATRTSPVIRGKWILENILGTPPPPPPPDVPALSENAVSANLPLRQRLAQHRADPACVSCHQLMDPVGFALENYDAVGRWRDLDQGRPVDAGGGLPGGHEFVGIEGLEQGLLARPEIFVGTMTEKLLTYALGRGREPLDGPAIRKIVREAKADDFCFSSLILGIVKSTPFQTRISR